MADQPALEVRGFGLNMELQAERRLAEGEGLVRRDVGGSQPFGARREIESVAVPVQDKPILVQMFQAGLKPGRGERDRPDADLPGLAGINARTKRPRQKLRAEADAER